MSLVSKGKLKRECFQKNISICFFIVYVSPRDALQELIPAFVHSQ